ncbi:hypothetical protein [Flagellimonas sp.]|uniref:hypothetical protein n=1 Tax=Flagellimonas sp. TaxID=2058762 RepID=UPI003F4A6127
MTEKELQEIEDRCNNATKGPWKSMIEGRDHTSGDSFIMTGGEDIYISNPLFDNNQDFIANAKQDIPKLIAEIRKLKKASS